MLPKVVCIHLREGFLFTFLENSANVVFDTFWFKKLAALALNLFSGFFVGLLCCSIRRDFVLIVGSKRYNASHVFNKAIDV